MTPLTVAKADQNQIIGTVNLAIEKAERYFKKKMAPITKIEFKHNLGATAGWCCTNNSDRSSVLKFNTILFNENKEKFLNRTVLHEVAHHIVYSVFGFHDRCGKKIMPHGKHFKAVMVMLGVEDITRCHSYDVSNAQTMKRTRKVAKPYQYKCACMVHNVTANIHNKMVRGQKRCCSGCKTSLTLVK